MIAFEFPVLDQCFTVCTLYTVKMLYNGIIRDSIQYELSIVRIGDQGLVAYLNICGTLVLCKLSKI